MQSVTPCDNHLINHLLFLLLLLFINHITNVCRDRQYVGLALITQ